MNSYNFIHYSASYTDLYQLTMAQVYFLQGRTQTPVVFDYFFRKLPFKGGYVVSCGQEVLLDALDKFYFNDEDLKFLASNGFHREFLEYLKGFKFRGTLYSVLEGMLVFPNCPILIAEGNLIECQIAETIILNILNFQSLIATKASRMRQVAKEKTLIDFGVRRAQGPASYYATRAATIGGFNATSHVKAAMDFGIPASGTMAHSFIQSMPDELSAFRAYAQAQQEKCVLLVDTYDTLRSGVPNAIKIGKELENAGHRLLAIRLDSGDLAYLAKESRTMLDKAGLAYVQIAASNQLDEYVIKSLEEQKAPIDIYGVGTNLVTGAPDGALDGVYKMSEINGNATIKMSENITKTTLPGRKKVYRTLNENSDMGGVDAVVLNSEEEVKKIFHPTDPYKSMQLDKYRLIPLLQPIMQEGKNVLQREKIFEISTFSQKQLESLPAEYKRFENPHQYKVGISNSLMELRNSLIRNHPR